MKLNSDKTWNLADMFPDDAAWERQMEEVRALGAQLAARKGHAADSAAALLETATLYDSLNCKGAQCAVYAECRFHTDMASPQGKEMVGKLEVLFTALGEQTAFLAPELMQYSYADFERYCAACPQLRVYDQLARDFFDRREHVLDDVGEAMLTRMADLGGTYRQVFEDLVINDTQMCIRDSRAAAARPPPPRCRGRRSWGNRAPPQCRRNRPPGGRKSRRW